MGHEANVQQAETDVFDSRWSANRTMVGVIGLLLGILVLLVPVFVAPLPPLGDYPNHLARMWLLSSSAAQASMAQFYHVQFDTYTNIAIDLIALTLGKVAGYVVAGRFSIALAIVLAPLGGALLWWSVYRRVHWWMLSFGLLAWGSITINGFLNYQIAIGLALVFAALEHWLVVRSWLVQICARAFLSAILLLAHPFGLLFYALLISALIVGPTYSAIPWLDLPRRLAPVAIAALGVVVLFILFTPSLPGTEEHSGLRTIPAEVLSGFQIFHTHPVRKIFNVLFAIRAYNNVIDALTLVAFVTPLALAAAMGRIEAHFGLFLLSVVLVAVYLICPNFLLGAGWVDSRFAVMFAFALAASLAPTLPAVAGRFAAALLALFFVGRTIYIAQIWLARQADVAALAEAIEPLPAGSSLITLENRTTDRSKAPRGRYTSGGENSFRHLPNLAVPWHQVFVPTLFSARGKQPVIALPPWNSLADPNAGILNDIHIIDPVPPEGLLFEGNYIGRWRDFDYLLILNADIPDQYGPFNKPAYVSLVRDAGFAKLYRIDHEKRSP